MKNQPDDFWLIAAVSFMTVFVVGAMALGFGIFDNKPKVQPTATVTPQKSVQPTVNIANRTPIKSSPKPQNSLSNQTQSGNPQNVPKPVPSMTLPPTVAPTKEKGCPASATARCRDGWCSYSQSRRGTCSHHGGVAEWY